MTDGTGIPWAGPLAMTCRQVMRNLLHTIPVQVAVDSCALCVYLLHSKAHVPMLQCAFAELA